MFFFFIYVCIVVAQCRFTAHTVIFALCGKCPYSEFFWSLFSPNVGKYGTEKLEIRTLFTQCCLSGTFISKANVK